jgi:predicted phage terminase large subunit-like protein
MSLNNQQSKKKALLEELLHTERMSDELEYWAENVSKDFVKPHEDPTPAAHHRIILYWLNEVAEGRIKNLGLEFPPGSAKSTYAAKIFPAQFMSKYPKTNVIVSSSSKNLSLRHSNDIQTLVRAYSRELGNAPVNDSKEMWACSNGSSLLAASTGTAIQGFRCDLAVVDDAVGGIDDAYSELMQNKTWDWFDVDLKGRMTPDSRMVVIGTRWHQSDLLGKIRDEAAKPGGDEWFFLSMPAVWEHDYDEPEFPYGLGRKANSGTLLWPKYHDQSFIDNKRKGSEAHFQALYQANPLPAGGILFKPDLIKPIPACPTPIKRVRAWDFAATKKFGSDYTVGVLMARLPSGEFVVEDVIRLKGDPTEVRQLVINTAHNDGLGTIIAFPRDPGQAGIWQAKDLSLALAGFIVEHSPESGSKTDRAKPYAAQVGAGNVKLVEGAWNKEYRDELKGFPNLKHDDQVDASSRAFGSLIELNKIRVKTRWSRGSLNQR